MRRPISELPAFLRYQARSCRSRMGRRFWSERSDLAFLQLSPWQDGPPSPVLGDDQPMTGDGCTSARALKTRGGPWVPRCPPMSLSFNYLPTVGIQEGDKKPAAPAQRKRIPSLRACRRRGGRRWALGRKNDGREDRDPTCRLPPASPVHGPRLLARLRVASAVTQRHSTADLAEKPALNGPSWPDLNYLPRPLCSRWLPLPAWRGRGPGGLARHSSHCTVCAYAPITRSSCAVSSPGYADYA